MKLRCWLCAFASKRTLFSPVLHVQRKKKTWKVSCAPPSGKNIERLFSSKISCWFVVWSVFAWHRITAEFKLRSYAGTQRLDSPRVFCTPDFLLMPLCFSAPPANCPWAARRYEAALPTRRDPCGGRGVTLLSLNFRISHVEVIAWSATSKWSKK